MTVRSQLPRIRRYAVRRVKRAGLSPVRRLLRWYVRAAPRPDGTADANRRVFILLGSAWGMGGTIRSIHNLAGHLAKTHEVEILSLARRRQKPFFEFEPGVKVTALDDQRPGATPRGLRLLHRILSGRSSALMHPADHAAAGANLWMDVRLVRKLRGQSGFLIGTRPGLNLIAADLSPPGLITIGEEQMHLHAHSGSLKRAMKRLYPKLDALAVLTERDLHEYDKLLSGGLRLARIPNTARQMPGPKADLSARVVLAAGRLTRQKGFDLLIEAFEPVASAHPDWRLRICGRGHLRGELRKQIDERGLSEVIELPGPRDLADEMAQASIFVLSSRFEGFPLVLLEAMSKGMAVVSFDCPTGPGDVVDDHRNGLLVPEKDVDGLAAAIIELIEDEDLRRRCAPAAVETARSYSVDAVGPQWEALLDELSRARDAALLPEGAAEPARYTPRP
jgi:glycosyltransferase involved in cell wall biosynthesis